MELEIDGFDAILRTLQADDEPSLRRIRYTPEVWQWWDDPEDGWPLPTTPSPSASRSSPATRLPA